MKLSISHSCPSCGAPVTLEEADRLTICAFCDVSNYMVDTGLMRFMLPDRIPESIENDHIYYFPYLRFKGNIFSCHGRVVDYKVLDTTYRGLEADSIPPTMGLRPQAMDVRIVNKGYSGKFIRRKDDAVTILRRASQLAESFTDQGSETLYHRAFIGETVSCIYLPTYIKDGTLFDGVLNRPVSSDIPWLEGQGATVGYNEKWEPTFLATICPHCGAAMHGKKDSMVLYCSNCRSCWAEQGGKFVSVPFSLVRVNDDAAVYLPFWKIEVTGSGIEMQTLADLLKVTNQPVVISEKHHRCALRFMVPAVKIRPAVFLKFAKNATLSQLKFPQGEREIVKNLYPVTLPLKEAVQALKCIVSEMAVNKKAVLPQLPSLSFKLLRSTLMFLPFNNTGHDLVQYHCHMSVPVTVVRQGRKL